MEVITRIDVLRACRKKMKEPLGLVPTMGYLHAGHISLVERAHRECASVAVSIFVNPTQFGPSEDLGSYPRDLNHDLELLRDAGVDLVWTPAAVDLYPEGYQTWVSVDDLTRQLEGASRPGHFRGVTTVVAKLFNVVQPQRAYFGQKDAQQAAVIRRMVADLNFPIDIRVCPIIRESDGLAMSSRNSYLSSQERQAARVLHRALSAAVQACRSGEKDGDKLRAVMEEILSAEPAARIDYVSCAAPNTLQELAHVGDSALFSMAVAIGKTRLIDNMEYSEKES